jgi:arylsulfatase B/arylsulfatase I/J
LNALLANSSTHHQRQQAQPNVVIFLIDDLGYDDMGWHTDQIRTPVMDKFRDEGQLLEWYYAQCVCSATRASLLSGRYSLHTGVNGWIPPDSSYGLPLSDITIADIFSDVGYATHAIGKWHTGFYKWRYTPTYRGFDSFYGYYSGGEDYYTHFNGGGFDFREDNGANCGPNCSRIATETYGQYSTFLYTNRTIEIIIDHATDNNKNKKPLFLYVAYQSVNFCFVVFFLELFLYTNHYN